MKYLILLLISGIANAQTTTIPNNTVAIGKTGATNKTLEFNLTKAGATANPKIRWNNSLSTIQFSNDGSTFNDIGSGSGTLEVKGQEDGAYTAASNLQVPANQATITASGITLLETGSGNILPDPGFEALTSGWTASGGATSTANATAKGTGAKGYDWDSNGAAQTLVSTSVTIPNGYKGKNGFFSCNIKTVSGTATHTITVNDGTNDIATAFTIPNSTTSFINTYNNGQGNFVYPSSGTIRIKITAVSASEPEIYVDDCEIGLAKNVGSVAQAVLIDAITVTGCAGAWTTTSASFATLGTQTGCTYTSAKGVATAPATNIPAFKFSSLSPGDYRIEYEGRIGTSAGNDSFSQFSDGINTARENTYITNQSGTGVNMYGGTVSQTISYSAPQSNVTLDLKAKVAGGSTVQIYGTTSNPGVFKLWYFPSASQQAVSSAQADYSGGTYSLTSSNTQGIGTPTSATCTHDRVGGNLLLDCKYTLGTTTSSEMRVNLPNSLISADTTKIPTIQVAGTYARGGSASAAKGGFVLIEPSVGYVTFSSNDVLNSASKDPLAKVLGTDSTSGFVYSFKASIPIQGWSSNQRAPTLVGSVTSNSSGAERIERAGVTSSCTSTPCTIASQSDSWLTSVTRGSTGNYTANFSTAFTSAPQCWVSCEGGGVQNNCFARMSTIGSSSVQFITLDATAGPSVVDSKFSILCMGPR